MKKALSVVISGLLVITLLAVFIGNVKAESWLPEPYAKGIGNTPKFTSQVVVESSLPGTTRSLSGLLQPVGFQNDENKFDGDGITLKGITRGKVSICFPLTGVQYGWGGKIGQWTGTNWKFLPTTITSLPESTVSWACTEVTSNGTFAFIKWVADFSKLPPPDAPTAAVVAAVPCGYGITKVISNSTASVDHGSYYTSTITQLNIWAPISLKGKAVTVTIISPDAAITLDSSISGTLDDGWKPGENYSLTPPSPVGYTYSKTLSGFTWHLDFGTCTEDVAATMK